MAVASQVTRRPEYYTTALEWSSFRMHNVFVLFDAPAAGKCFPHVLHRMPSLPEIVTLNANITR